MLIIKIIPGDILALNNIVNRSFFSISGLYSIIVTIIFHTVGMPMPFNCLGQFDIIQRHNSRVIFQKLFSLFYIIMPYIQMVRTCRRELHYIQRIISIIY